LHFSRASLRTKFPFSSIGGILPPRNLQRFWATRCRQYGNLN
jgi:hypothetical protein